MQIVELISRLIPLADLANAFPEYWKMQRLSRIIADFLGEFLFFIIILRLPFVDVGVVAFVLVYARNFST